MNFIRKYRLSLYILTLISCVLATRSDADVVRTIYLKAADMPTPAEQEIDSIRDIMIKTQQFYRNEMLRHGYGAKTFALEVDTQNNVIVHVVNGKNNLVTYTDNYAIEKELPDHLKGQLTFAHEINVIFIAGLVKIGSGAINFTTCHENACKQTTLIPAANAQARSVFTAHEIGHAFGLMHNGDLGKPLMKVQFLTVNNAPLKLSDYSLSDYEARWLNKHRHFNLAHTLNAFPDIISIHKLISLEVEDKDSLLFMIHLKGNNRLYQSQISRQRDGVVLGWDRLSDVKDTAKIIIGRSKVTPISKVQIQVMDRMGNIKGHLMSIVLPQMPQYTPEPVPKPGSESDYSVTWSRIKMRDEKRD